MDRSLALLAVALLVAGPALAHFELVPPRIGLGSCGVAGLLGLLVAIRAVVRLVRRSSPGLRSAAIDLALALVPVAAVVVAVAGAAGHPAINDVTTNLADPPALSVAPDYPDDLEPIVARTYPDLKTLVVDRPPGEAFDLALAAARARDGWQVTAVMPDRMVFEGVATTRLFHFKDDFTVRVRSVRGARERRAGQRAAIDMRSRSRVGKSDLGANAARIREFLAELR